MPTHRKELTTMYYDSYDTPLGDYKKEKLRMLEEDFRLRLTFEEIEAINSCTSDLQADRVARDILRNKL